ncbi:MAG TPA: MnhB domain-containing protein [Acidimicrobiia bacterium]|nr:MnhB domain-containing protein [Acidimicrobiia bacterium]
MTPATRRAVFLVAGVGLLAFYLWGLTGLPAFGHYHGPYGDLIDAVAVAQTHATGIVSAVNFDYRGFDSLGEEFILFVAATGVATVLRELRGERAEAPLGEGSDADRPVSPTSETVRMAALVFTGPVLVLGWFLTTHAQTNPSGGFQGGVVMATAVFLVYLAGQFLVFKRLSPVDVTDAVEAVGAGGFAAVGLGVLATGASFLADVLPLGSPPGEVDASGTIALISFFVGVEVVAAFVLIANELLEQTIVIRQGP